VKRPTAPPTKGGANPQSRGYAITGHHELLLPLLAAALASNWPKDSMKNSRRSKKR